MKYSAFALALLAAGATAQHYDPMFDPHTYNPETDDTGENSILAGFKAWNCATCTLAFGGLDKFIQSDTFGTGMIKLATWICEVSGQVKNSSEICP